MWLEASAYVPAALDLLAKKGEAVAFIRALKITDAQVLLSGIIRFFALHKIEAALKAGREAYDSATGSELKERPVEQSTPRTARTHSSLHAATRPPWPKGLPETEGGGLNPDAQCLLGIGLMLRRAPSVVRSEAFARALFSWRQAVESERLSQALNSDETGKATRFDEAEKKPETQAIKLAQGAESKPASRPESIEQSDEDAATLTSRTEDVPHARPRGSAARKGTVEFRAEPPPVDLDSLSGAAPATVPAAQVDEAREVSDGRRGSPVRALPEGITEAAAIQQELEWTRYETEFGGLFYLINLGIFLGLYADFTAPAESAPPLPIWDFVALVGRELLGEKIESDPVWALLAVFAGRLEEQPPGHDFAAPESWRMPVDWLQPFAEKSVWHWSADGGRLRVGHPAGFLLLDVPLSVDEPAAQLLREIEIYREARGFELRSGSLSAEHETEPLSRWLNWLMPYVRARLQQALALSLASDLAHVLCEHYARIVCTATHLDIFLSLAELPIEIRFSGLDRDPGWVPAAGKFIAFHFE
jgi:hypothetical protein